MRTTHYRPIDYRTVCAIARVVLLRSPQMTDAEWKAAVKDTCQTQGWETPDSELVGRAMSAVERALEQTVGPRRIRELAPPPADRPTVDRGWSPADLTALADTVKRIQARSAGRAPSNVTAIPLERWEMSEAAALDEFYRQAETDRMAALKRFAEIAIARPADWDIQAVRADADAQQGLRSSWDGACFACRVPGRGRVSHHVLQIQFGGSNYVRNRVMLCDACHAAIHPWLPAVPRQTGEWFQVGMVASSRAVQVAITRSLRKDEAS